MSSERERMLRGDPYDTRDPELLAMAHRARALLADHATAPSTDIAPHSLAFGQPCRVRRTL